MNPIFLLPFSLIFLTACGTIEESPEDFSPENDYDALASRVAAISGNGPAVEATDRNEIAASPRPAQQGGTRTHTIPGTDPNIPMAAIDMPAHWTFAIDPRSGNWGVTAEDLVVKNYGYQSFMYAGGDMGYFYQQSGGKMRQPVMPEQLLREDIEPQLRKEGMEFVGATDAPMIGRADQQGLDGLVSFGQVRKSCRALASEWKKGDRRYLAVMHWNAMESPDMVNWGYYMTMLETNAANFEQEKAGLLNALSSVRYNPSYFAAYNQQEQMKAQQSWGAHNSRMQQNQAAFDAQQRAFRESSNATNQAIMNNYRSQDAASDRNQDAFINTIRGEQNAINPHTGEAIKIESGSQQYWMNQHGQYYGTDDVMHDPNIGNTTPDVWQQVPTEP